MQNTQNEHQETIAGFGDEWSRFDQSGAQAEDLEQLFNQYFAVFPWDALAEGARGIDVGCGTGRWARFVAPRVGRLDCVDASEEALAVAKRNLSEAKNVSLTQASVGRLPFETGSFDFGYSLGVLHHVPNTQAALQECVRVLKPGAPFLVYLYYALDNRPAWFRAAWKATDVLRRLVSRMPTGMRHVVADAVATGVYWPLARTARLGEQLGFDVSGLPLSAYRERGLYIMRNDALDRLGTQLEQRFSRVEIQGMMQAAGLNEIRFHEDVPFWCAVGTKSA